MDDRHGGRPARLRIALVAPPVKAVPPVGYGGTERIVAALAGSLKARGHDITVFASGDSTTEGHLLAVVPEALWARGFRGDATSYMQMTAARAWAASDRFDVIHSHLENHGFLMARYCRTPVVSTLHSRLDIAGWPALLDEFSDVPLVAISENQRRWSPDSNWVATIHHGLPLATMPHQDRPGDYLVVVGRISREKGIGEAIEVGRRSGLPLRVAAKVHRQDERELFESLVRPAVTAGTVEFLGELDAERRDPLLAGARATLMLGGWPEPFGLVAIESLAAGTPVIGRRAGALPELIEHGVDGFIVDDLDEAEHAIRLVGDLDRVRIRERALKRFSAERMAIEYEAVYERLAGVRSDTPRTTMTTPRDGGPSADRMATVVVAGRATKASSTVDARTDGRLRN